VRINNHIFSLFLRHHLLLFFNSCLPVFYQSFNFLILFVYTVARHQFMSFEAFILLSVFQIYLSNISKASEPLIKSIARRCYQMYALFYPPFPTKTVQIAINIGNNQNMAVLQSDSDCFFYGPQSTTTRKAAW